MEIVITMCKIIFSMAIGFFLYKVKILSKDFNTASSKLLINVGLPCSMFVAIATMESEDTGSVYELLIVGVLVYVFLGLVAILVSKLMKAEGATDGIIRCLLIFGNVSFLGIPVVESLYGSTGVFYMAILNVHFNVFCFTYGVYLIAKGGEGEDKFSYKDILSPAVVSIVLALIIYLTGLKLPNIITEPLDFVGDITSPMAMITLGSIIATFSLKELFTQWKFYVLSALKMLILPAITFIVLRAIIGPGDITNVVTIYVAMPTASVISMMSVTYKSDSKTATYGVGLMNILCIVTIPVMYLFMEMVG